MNSENIINKKVTLSFIIINYNLAKEIEDCLNSLLEYIGSCGPVSYEIIIVDNNSPDGALVESEKKFVKENIYFYYLDKNLGFGKGCNYAFSKASGEYICFLNPDTLIKEDIFPQIIKIFESDKSIGAIGPKQQIRKPFFDFSAGFSPNLLFELFNIFGIGIFVEGFVLSMYQKLNKGKGFEVNWILGACIFTKADIFKSVGGFDKDYFMFFEEVDLCRRIAAKGYKIVYFPQLKIHHIGSVSGKRDYRMYAIRTYSSKYIYITKHFEKIKKNLMISLLYVEAVSQIMIWTILYPKNTRKSKQKISAFIYLLKNKMKL